MYSSTYLALTMDSAASLTGGGNSAKNPLVMACWNMKRRFLNSTASTCIGDYSEDGSERDFGRLDEGEHGKVPQEAWGDGITTTSGRGTGGTDCHILHKHTEYTYMGTLAFSWILILMSQLNPTNVHK